MPPKDIDMERTAEYWIDQLQLQAHPEGGFYKETYRAAEHISKVGLPDRFSGDRTFATAIYFLLRSQDISSFHRIQSDEGWFWHQGSSLTIYDISLAGQLTEHLLGSDPEKGEQLQVVILAQHWFGAKVNEPDSYTLVSCTVSPGFDFADFELAERDSLSHEFPQHSPLITELTHD